MKCKMVKVKIEVNGEEKQVIIGDMVNAVVLDENGCKIALVSDPSEQGIATGRFVKSLVLLVQNAIKAFAHGNSIRQSILNMCFALEMEQAACGGKNTEKRRDDDKSVERELDDLLNKILGEGIDE